MSFYKKMILISLFFLAFEQFMVWNTSFKASSIHNDFLWANYFTFKSHIDGVTPLEVILHASDSLCKFQACLAPVQFLMSKPEAHYMISKAPYKPYLVPSGKCFVVGVVRCTAELLTRGRFLEFCNLFWDSCILGWAAWRHYFVFVSVFSGHYVINKCHDY